jgi:hypothetical protein
MKLYSQFHRPRWKSILLDFISVDAYSRVMFDLKDFENKKKTKDKKKLHDMTMEATRRIHTSYLLTCTIDTYDVNYEF